MKKQKGKAQKPSGTRKKDDHQGVKEEAAAPGTTEQGEDTAEQAKPGTDKGNDEASTAFLDTKNGAVLDKPPEDAPETPAQNPAHSRQPSLSIQSKMRSSSFRRQSLSQGPLSPRAKSPDLPILTPDGDSVSSIYRKQAARLDELERENRRLAREAQENEKRWKQTEEELEELREASGDVARLKSRVEKADAQIEEFNKMVRLHADSIYCLYRS